MWPLMDLKIEIHTGVHVAVYLKGNKINTFHICQNVF